MKFYKFINDMHRSQGMSWPVPTTADPGDWLMNHEQGRFIPSVDVLGLIEGMDMELYEMEYAPTFPVFGKENYHGYEWSAGKGRLIKRIVAWDKLSDIRLYEILGLEYSVPIWGELYRRSWRLQVNHDFFLQYGDGLTARRAKRLASLDLARHLKLEISHKEITEVLEYRPKFRFIDK